MRKTYIAALALALLLGRPALAQDDGIELEAYHMGQLAVFSFECRVRPLQWREMLKELVSIELPAKYIKFTPTPDDSRVFAAMSKTADQYFAGGEDFATKLGSLTGSTVCHDIRGWPELAEADAFIKKEKARLASPDPWAGAGGK